MAGGSGKLVTSGAEVLQPPTQGKESSFQVSHSQGQTVRASSSKREK